VSKPGRKCFWRPESGKGSCKKRKRTSRLQNPEKASLDHLKNKLRRRKTGRNRSLNKKFRLKKSKGEKINPKPLPVIWFNGRRLARRGTRKKDHDAM